MMDCSGFELELAAVMDGERPEDVRGALLQRLAAHARGCRDCAGTEELLLLLAQPIGQRDLVPDPGERYWATFDARLKERIASDPDAARPQWSGWRHAVAAAALLLVSGTLIWNSSTNPLHPTGAPDWPRPLQLALARLPAVVAIEQLEELAGMDEPWPSDMTTEFPATAVSMDALIGDAAAGEAIGELELLAELSAWNAGPGEDLDDGLFPDTGEMSPEVRSKLLDWLDRQNLSPKGVS